MSSEKLRRLAGSYRRPLLRDVGPPRPGYSPNGAIPGLSRALGYVSGTGSPRGRLFGERGSSQLAACEINYISSFLLHCFRRGTPHPTPVFLTSNPTRTAQCSFRPSKRARAALGALGLACGRITGRRKGWRAVELPVGGSLVHRIGRINGTL